MYTLGALCISCPRVAFSQACSQLHNPPQEKMCGMWDAKFSILLPISHFESQLSVSSPTFHFVFQLSIVNPWQAAAGQCHCRHVRHEGEVAD